MTRLAVLMAAFLFVACATSQMRVEYADDGTTIRAIEVEVSGRGDGAIASACVPGSDRETPNVPSDAQEPTRPGCVHAQGTKISDGLADVIRAPFQVVGGLLQAVGAGMSGG